MTSSPQNLQGCRVLLSGHLPPPMGGIAMFYQSLLHSSLSSKVDLEFVQTSSQKRALSESGQASLSNLLSALQDCFRFWKAVRKHKPHLAHIATAPGFSFLKHGLCVLIADLYGSRVLIHPHCSLTALYYDRPRLWRWFVRQIIRRTDGLIALSKEWEQIDTILPGHPVFLLPNAIDQKDYQAIARDRFDHIQQSAPVRILYLGYIGKAKGTYDLIEAACRVLIDHHNVEFHLVGDELNRGERQALRQQVASAGLGDKIQIHLAVNDHRKLDFFRMADIFVYPSYHEGMPMAVIEAMASGLPVVATNVGGLPDLVQDGKNGLLVSAGKPIDLSLALNRVIGDADLRSQMQHMSSQLAAQHYDIEKLVSELIKIYGRFIFEKEKLS